MYLKLPCNFKKNSFDIITARNMALNQCCLCLENVDADAEEEPAVLVTEQRYTTLCRCSRERGDNYVVLRFRNTTGTYVHEKCYNTYIHHRNIERYKQMLLQPPEEEPARAAENVEPVLRTFDFENLCIFCRQSASDEFQKKEARKRANQKKEIVRRVSNKQTIDNIKTHCDSGNAAKYTEVIQVLPLIDLNNYDPRYHAKCMIQFYGHKAKQRVTEPMYKKIVDHIMEYLHENTEEPQYSLDTILENYVGDIPASCRVIDHLKDLHGDDVLITTRSRKFIICLRSTGYETLINAWEKNKNSDIETEKTRFLNIAADILVEEIRSMDYSNDVNPSAQNLLTAVDNAIPDGLRHFLQKLIFKHKKKPDNYKTRVLSTAHAMISAVRPKVISPLQIVLGFVLNKRYASKELINMLHKLGVVSSYKECQVFENSMVLHKRNSELSLNFSQYVFDNCDHNVNTIDGHKTFHVMGGIQIVTPAAAVIDDSEIQRQPRIQTENQQNHFTSIPLLRFQRAQGNVIGPTTFTNLLYQRPNDFDFSLSNADFLWLYGKHIGHENVKGWNGFMEYMPENTSFDKSRIIFLPIIDNSASNYDTIYSALKYAVDKSKEMGQKHCIVTFDQPLY